jgi:carboxyl-terminal processing protease
VQNAAQRGGEPPPPMAMRTAAFQPSWQVSPPRLTLKDGPSLVDVGTYHLSGVAKDDKKLSDVFVFVSNRAAKIDHRKVFYRSNRKGATPLEMGFDADIPLWPGANLVTVVARQNPQVQSQETLVVQRSGPHVTQTAAAPEPLSKTPQQ